MDRERERERERDLKIIYSRRTSQSEQLTSVFVREAGRDKSLSAGRLETRENMTKRLRKKNGLFLKEREEQR